MYTPGFGYVNSTSAATACPGSPANSRACPIPPSSRSRWLDGRGGTVTLSKRCSGKPATGENAKSSTGVASAAPATDRAPASSGSITALAATAPSSNSSAVYGPAPLYLCVARGSDRWSRHVTAVGAQSGPRSSAAPSPVRNCAAGQSCSDSSPGATLSAAKIATNVTSRSPSAGVTASRTAIPVIAHPFSRRAD